MESLLGLFEDLQSKQQSQKLTNNMPPLVVLHDIFAVEHLTADFTWVEFLSMFLFVLGQITVGGEKPRAYFTLERFVICKKRRTYETDVVHAVKYIFYAFIHKYISKVCIITQVMKIEL